MSPAAGYLAGISCEFTVGDMYFHGLFSIFPVPDKIDNFSRIIRILAGRVAPFSIARNFDWKQRFINIIIWLIINIIIWMIDKLLSTVG